MLAFEVLVNGKRLCIASTATHRVSALDVSWAKRRADRIDFHVGGLDGEDASLHTAWETPTLAIGDEVSFRLIDTEIYDQPDNKYRPTDRCD